ncbi:MAG: PIN domain-containing protein [Gammaproteobacteria bacterium]|nr:PIN domain-containing protein [Nitrococcus sp.]MDN5865282.1 PIN domain-containing protein [Gammaproteobacteria bacterium]
MNGYLLDVNVLIALTWPTHVHHAIARRWFDRNAAAGWATCPITQLGFVRVSSNRKVIRDAAPPREAVAMLERLMRLPEHTFWPDEIGVVSKGPFASLAFVGHRQATDAYLLALARKREGKLATLDKGVAELISKRNERSRWVEWIAY